MIGGVVLQVGRTHFAFGVDHHHQADRDSRQQQQHQQKKSFEAERHNWQERKRKQIDLLLAQAYAEEEKQNKKWFGKDYHIALALYEQASNLGSNVARERLNRFKSK